MQVRPPRAEGETVGGQGSGRDARHKGTSLRGRSSTSPRRTWATPATCVGRSPAKKRERRGVMPGCCAFLSGRSRLVSMGMPETLYARSGDIAIAYQVLGAGPFDVVFAPGAVSHVELNWDSPGLAALLRGIAGHARLIVCDKRGTGLSDRDVGVPTLEDRSDDIRAVMDAAGSQRGAGRRLGGRSDEHRVRRIPSCARV